jgi:hypothetical protein
VIAQRAQQGQKSSPEAEASGEHPMLIGRISFDGKQAVENL